MKGKQMSMARNHMSMKREYMSTTSGASDSIGLRDVDRMINDFFRVIKVC